MVACDATVPGIPNMTEAMVSLVVVTANMPSISAKAETGSMVWVNGSSRIRPVTPPIPGKAPSQTPRNMPNPR